MAYVGSVGTHLFKRMNYNVARPGPEPLRDRLPFPRFAGMIHDKAIGRSTYNGMQVDLNKRFASGFSYKVGYTWSRSMDLGTTQGESYVPWNTKLDRGRTEFDVRHRLVLSSVADLPFGRGKRFASLCPRRGPCTHKRVAGCGDRVVPIRLSPHAAEH